MTKMLMPLASYFTLLYSCILAHTVCANNAFITATSMRRGDHYAAGPRRFKAAIKVHLSNRGNIIARLLLRSFSSFSKSSSLIALFAAAGGLLLLAEE